MSNKIRSVSEAPARRPILTEEGLVIFLDDGKWYYCDMYGTIFYDADGMKPEADPVYWIDISELAATLFKTEGM